MSYNNEDAHCTAVGVRLCIDVRPRINDIYLPSALMVSISFFSICLGDWKEKDGFYEHLLTSFTSTEIILKANFLQLKKRYQIKFRVLTEHGGEGYTYYNFRTNTPPQGGSCEMDKSTGQAVLDEFELQCYDWIDHDLPLMYQVNIPKLDGTYIVFAVAPNNSITLRLPVGDKNYGYHLRLEVFIMDSLKASSKVNVSIFVS